MSSSVRRGQAAAAAFDKSSARSLADRASEAAFLVEYLYKSRRDICEGFRQLEGDQLREHLLHVLSLVVRIAGIAIDVAIVAARFVSVLSNALQKYNLGVGTSMAPAALLALALAVAGTLMWALSGSQKAGATGGDTAATGSVIIEVVRMIQAALTDTLKRCAI